MDGPSSATSANSRQKRVLPSRSRRGGPGLGTCDVDNLILETRRRKYENEPLIPAETHFLLTTDPAYDAEPSDGSHSGMKINIVANERYFDRPDVLKAFREQILIQTPEFHELQELASGVGSRFRPRNQEESMSETSDAAYEKRHKKFETYEKRQRFREKEKLKHEHYKLKERIDQLRAMEGAAFMNLPESSFSPAQSRPVGGDDPEEDLASISAMNGGIYHPEGERRRKEMLDIAVKLERRYAYLLPPDRVRKGQEPSNAGAASARSIAVQDEEDSEGERIAAAGPSRRDTALKVRLPPLRSSASSTPTPSPIPTKPSAMKKPKPAYSMSKSLSTRSRRKSSPPPVHFPSPPQMQHLPPTEQRPMVAHSPIIDVERESIEPERPSTSPPSSVPPTPEPSSKVSEPVPELSVQYSTPPELSKEQNEEVENVSLTNGTRIIQMAPASVLMESTVHDLDVDMQPVNGNGDSEKALSEVLEEPKSPEVVSKLKQKSKGKKKSTAKNPYPPNEKHKNFLKSAVQEEQLPEEEAIVMSKKPSPTPEPKIINEHEVGQKLANSLQSVEPVSEATNAEPQSTFVTTIDPNLQVEVPQEPAGEDTISVRPSKRRRKDKETPLESSYAAVRTPSAQPSERERTALAARHRGGPFTTYISERDNCVVRTYSTLIIAATRSKDGTRRVARDRYAFGFPTPEFQKQPEVDFELPIYFRYAREPTASVDGSDERVAEDQEEDEKPPPSPTEVEDAPDQSEDSQEQDKAEDGGDGQPLTDLPIDQPMETAPTTSDENTLKESDDRAVGKQVQDLEITHSPDPENRMDTSDLKAPQVREAFLVQQDEEDQLDQLVDSA